MGKRLLTALGAVAAAVAVVCALALLFTVLDGSGDGGTGTSAVVRVSVAAGKGGSGQVASGSVEGRQGESGQVASGRVGSRKVDGGQGESGEAVRTGRASTPAAAGPARVPSVLHRPRRGTAFAIARVRAGARVDLHAKPGGPIVARAGAETAFGSPAAFSVVVTKPGWLGVTAPEMPNGKLAWIARDPRKVDVYWTRWSLHASLSARDLELRYGKQTVARFAVTVGGMETATPPGRYGVTDGIRFPESPYYGCCALALSGHQTHELPAGWIGGDRLAIHGTPGAVGNAESLGCIRATDEAMRYLFRRVPLGTPVFIGS